MVQAVLAAEDDPVKLAPDRYKVILNNNKVRVLDVRLKPDQKSPMHSEEWRIARRPKHWETHHSRAQHRVKGFRLF
jgi:hypothetical protein